VLKSPSRALYKVQAIHDPETSRTEITFDKFPRYAFAGDRHNPATFWASRFYSADQAKEWKVSELIPFAVQIVVDAASTNIGSISGLEVVYCDDAGFHCFSDLENRRWEAEAARRSREMESLLVSPFPESDSARN